MTQSPDPLDLFFDDFIASARASLSDLNQLLSRARTDASADVMESIVRAFHSMKGNASFFDGAAITPLARAAEAAADRASRCAQAEMGPVLDVLWEAHGALTEMVDASEEARRAVAGEGPMPLIERLERLGPPPAESRYEIMGTDVTDDVRRLTEAADAGATTADGEVTAAVARLARVARESDVHDVARMIEEALPPRRGKGKPAPEVDGQPLRAALRALAPLLARIDG